MKPANLAILGILVLLAIIAFELRDVGPHVDPTPGSHAVVPCYLVDPNASYADGSLCDDPNTTD